MEAMYVIRVGMSKNWLGDVHKGESFSVETILQTMLEN